MKAPKPYDHTIEINFGAEAWRTDVKVDGKTIPVSRVRIDTGIGMHNLTTVTLETDLPEGKNLTITGTVFATRDDFDDWLRRSELVAQDLGMRRGVD